LIVLIAFLALGWYLGTLRANRVSNSVINALNGKIRLYEYKYDSVVKYAAEKDQLIISQKQAIVQHLIDKKELKALNFKKVNEVTMLKAQVKLLLDSIKPDHPVIIVNCDTVIDQPVLYLPVEFIAPKSEFYELKVSLNETAEMFVDLSVPLDMDIWSGVDKKTKEFKVVVSSLNPFVKINDIKSFKCDIPRPNKRFGIGIQAGYGITKEITLSPYIGIGLSYNLFRF